MTFEIETPTAAKLLDIHVLSQKNRAPDQNPGVQLFFAMKLSNHALTGFDGSLKSFLFTRNGGETVNRRKDTKTETLDGVEPVSDLPNLSKIGSAVKTLKWGDKITGVELGISFATGKQLVLDDCTADRFRIAAQEGGTVLLNFIVEAPDAEATVFSKLAKFKSREIEITLVQHEPAQQDIDDDPAPPKRGGKAAAPAPAPKSATEAFIERHAPAH